MALLTERKQITTILSALQPTWGAIHRIHLASMTCAGMYGSGAATGTPVNTISRRRPTIQPVPRQARCGLCEAAIGTISGVTADRLTVTGIIHRAPASTWDSVWYAGSERKQQRTGN